MNNGHEQGRAFIDNLVRPLAEKLPKMAALALTGSLALSGCAQKAHEQDRAPGQEQIQETESPAESNDAPTVIEWTAPPTDDEVLQGFLDARSKDHDGTVSGFVRALEDTQETSQWGAALINEKIRINVDGQDVNCVEATLYMNPDEIPNVDACPPHIRFAAWFGWSEEIGQTLNSTDVFPDTMTPAEKVGVSLRFAEAVHAGQDYRSIVGAFMGLLSMDLDDRQVYDIYTVVKRDMFGITSTIDGEPANQVVEEPVVAPPREQESPISTETGSDSTLHIDNLVKNAPSEADITVQDRERCAKAYERMTEIDPCSWPEFLIAGKIVETHAEEIADFTYSAGLGRNEETKILSELIVKELVLAKLMGYDHLLDTETVRNGAQAYGDGRFDPSDATILVYADKLGMQVEVLGSY